MSDTNPSSTAIGAAMLRAAHQLLDAEPRILDDRLAMPLAGFADNQALLAGLEQMRASFTRRVGAEFTESLLTYLRASIVLRNRYAEDELETAMLRGTAQYVLLGAGLDSFAYRRPDLAAQIRIFEVDLPATQHWKKKRLAELKIHVPDSVSFVPADFERQSLLETLSVHGFSMQDPAFFSWLGVTGYLTEEAIFRTLRQVAASAAGSEIVFGYSLSEATDNEHASLIRKAIRAEIAERNEPAANSGFDSERLAEQVRALGFGEVHDFGQAAANDRYFACRQDKLRAPGLTHHMRARVGT